MARVVEWKKNAILARFFEGFDDLQAKKQI
jgi:hypothetical protein